MFKSTLDVVDDLFDNNRDFYKRTTQHTPILHAFESPSVHIYNENDNDNKQNKNFMGIKILPSKQTDDTPQTTQIQTE